jgi:hypothetical protein
LRKRHRLFGSLVALLLAGLFVAIAPPAVASAPDDDGLAKISIQIDTLTPLSPGPKDTLRITGKVINHGGPTVTDTMIALHLGKSVSSRTELQGLRAQPVPQLCATAQCGQRLESGVLEPGHSLPFTISIPISALALPGKGVYPMQVTSVGTERGTPRDLATVSTFLPYLPADAGNKVASATPVAFLVPLTAHPSLLADGTFAADGRAADTNALLNSVAPNGRLRHVLDGLSTPGVRASAIIDPALVRALALATNGRYQITTVGTSHAVIEPASADARRWLNDLRTASGIDLIGLPYANADIEALLHNGQRALADTARTRGDEVLATGLGKATAAELTSGVAVPPGGHVDATGAAYYAKQVGTSKKPEALVLSADSVPAAGDNPSATARVPEIPERLLLSDAVLTQLVTAGPGGNMRLAEQQVIAELAEAHLEDSFSMAPRGSTEAQPLLIAPSAGWNPPASWLSRLLADTAKLSWLQQVQIDDLLSMPAEPRAGLQYPPSARNAEVAGPIVDAAAQITTATEGLFHTPQEGDPAEPRSPSSIVQPIRDAALSAVSSDLRTNTSASQTFLDSAQAAFGALQQQVRVVASPQVTLTSKSGKVPVTIENNLDAAVDVSLELTSLDRSRVSSGTVVTRTVRAGQKVQVEVTVHAASAGTFPVRLALYTPSGQALGAPAQVLVRSTAYGVVATIFTIVALSVLGLAVLWRAIRALLRRSRGQRTDPEPAAPSSAGIR